MLKRSLRLRKNSAYRKVFAEGACFPGKYVVIYIIKGEEKYGFVASRKVGNAVQRNRAKRQMREIVRLNKAQLFPDKQMVFIARSSIKRATYLEIERSIDYSLHRIRKAFLKK
ncbi:MAG: ribonuclease P protein component [Peptococcaceae bacterium]|jgi:ribonuclease P protein component|nr:ribonuclease P protein component [Peptococcaceae bacterium]